MAKITLPLIAALLAIPSSSISARISPRPGISIVTANMANEKSASRILREWSSTPLLHNADILLLQEVQEEAGARRIANWVDQVLPLPALRPQAVAVDEFMRKQGFRSATPDSATTLDYLGLHLDWIWISELHSTGSQVLRREFSDHHAVWTRLASNPPPLPGFPPLKSPPDYL